ncbi:MAG: hypothetical protein JXR70_02565 [Spirochaetales bacterium]|nr:hypothetical protein [Spirochaetales bacterium]
MSDKIDFSLPPKKNKGNLPVVIILLGVLILLSGAALVLQLVPGKQLDAGESMAYLDSRQQKDLALKFQSQSLNDAAVKAWEAYMQSTDLPREERANILYNIGKIYQDAGNYEKALEHYYLSESVHKNKEITQEISRRIQESLESMGKFAALRKELSRRVGMVDQVSGDEVLAKIGPEKITRTDVDRKIEQLVELQLTMSGIKMDPKQREDQKRLLFKQYSDDKYRYEILNSMIVEEVLYRRAREEKIADEDATKALMQSSERQILGQRLLAKKMEENISITQDDAEAYYNQNTDKYDGSFESNIEKVYQDLRAQKAGEYQQNFLGQLEKEYDVLVFEKAPTQAQ